MNEELPVAKSTVQWGKAETKVTSALGTAW